MSASQDKERTFEKVGECLYRYVPTGTYYARIKRATKEVRRSLDTTDRATAKRKLADLHKEVDRTEAGAGRVTVAKLCEKYLATVQHQKPKTLKRKRHIAARLLADFPGGADVPVGKVKPSQVSSWLASYPFGVASYNLFLEFARAIFNLAVEDRLIGDSPVAHIKTKAREKPIRKTPSFEDFRAIVADIRGQQWNADARDSGDFVEFIGLAGLGQAEVGSLTWDDIDFANDRINTFRHKTKRGFMVPIYPQLKPLLERMRAERGGNPAGAERVFRLKDAKKSISGACRRLCLPAYSHRSFRRMFITRAIERGVDVKVIASWQGHRDGGKLILDTYSHVRPAHADAMALKMTAD